MMTGDPAVVLQWGLILQRRWLSPVRKVTYRTRALTA